MKRLTYLSVAEKELAYAIKYYDERQPGLGRKFLDAVAKTQEAVRACPSRWAFYGKQIRSARVWPFPHRILYRELPDRVQIVSVFHLSRRPVSWKKRL